jgi:hypothetical protein
MEWMAFRTTVTAVADHDMRHSSTSPRFTTVGTSCSW